MLRQSDCVSRRGLLLGPRLTAPHRAPRLALICLHSFLCQIFSFCFLFPRFSFPPEDISLQNLLMEAKSLKESDPIPRTTFKVYFG